VGAGGSGVNLRPFFIRLGGNTRLFINLRALPDYFKKYRAGPNKISDIFVNTGLADD
jgi:hypothetical protein